mmetsp:Transcript_13511/g.34665  ORF Transcript_13511/g.34665 Transcript_13511/m.34665 type:complete len:268 (-) Transcript_13511:310-1113(-)
MWLRQMRTSPQWDSASHSLGSRSRQVSMMSLRSLYRCSERCCCCSTLRSTRMRLLSCSSTSGCSDSRKGSVGVTPTSGSCHHCCSRRTLAWLISSCASETPPSCSFTRALIIISLGPSSTCALGRTACLREIQSGSFHRQSISVSSRSTSRENSMMLSHWLSCLLHCSHWSIHSACSPRLSDALLEEEALVMAWWKTRCPLSSCPCCIRLSPVRVSSDPQRIFHSPASMSVSLSWRYSSARASKQRVSCWNSMTCDSSRGMELCHEL